jgi:type IV pilus assembly protein PilC
VSENDTTNTPDDVGRLLAGLVTAATEPDVTEPDPRDGPPPTEAEFEEIAARLEALTKLVRQAPPSDDLLPSTPATPAARLKRFKGMLARMREQIQNGVPFSDAVAEHDAVFPPYYIGILRSSELTGQLDTALEQLSTYIERDVEARSTIKSALIYPMVVLCMSIFTVIVLAVWVLPKFTKFFKSLGAHLPLPTRMLLGVSDVTQKFWFVWIALIVVFVAVLIWMHQTEKGQRVRDRLFLRVPLVKDVVLFAVVERVCRIIAAMVKSGVPLPDTLAAAIQGTNNKIFEEALQGARERMLEGEGLAQPITDTQLFPKAATQMMQVGEDTGTLDTQLDNAAQYYGRELEYRLKKLTSLFEPMVIIFMGVIVGFVAVALISAMYGIFNQTKTIKGGK